MPASPPVTDATAAARRRPGALLCASAGVHAGAIGALVAHPGLWPWALGAVAANHLVIGGAGLWPRSSLLGPNCTHLPGAAAACQIALTIDDGPDPEVTPRVLELLRAHKAHATFFCIGERVRRYPELTREIVARGHGVENHTEHHPLTFSLLGPRAMAEEIRRAQESIEAATGEVAQFFRAPAGLRNPFLEPVLRRLNLRLASWTRRGFDTVEREPARILARLTRRLRGGDILLLHDGHAARTHAGTPVILEVLPPLLELIRQGALTPVTLREAFTAAATAP